MQIQINTDHNIEGYQLLAAQISGLVESALSRLSEHITRVEVHLSDENSHKSGQNDKHCKMEARLEGRQPIAVTHQAATVNQAVDGATGKLTNFDREHPRAPAGSRESRDCRAAAPVRTHKGVLSDTTASVRRRDRWSSSGPLPVDDIQGSMSLLNHPRLGMLQSFELCGSDCSGH